MINISLLHWEIKDRFNKLDSNHYQDLKKSQIDAAINHAVFLFKEHFAFVNRLPFEANQSRLDMLSPLVIRNVSVPVNEGKVTLPKDYANLVRATAKCGTVDIPVTFVDTEELTHILNDPYRKPSTRWGRVIAVFGESTFFTYSEDTLSTVTIDYIKDHKPVFFGEYNSVEFLDQQRRGLPTTAYSINTPPVDLELDFSYKDIIIDLAVFVLTGKTENPNLLNIVNSRLNLTQ